ncbi:ribonuclease E inhibitor RraB [Psychrobacter sp. DAB_AL43B]|uniref:ribonuclease E inhibitor RraB n=1 Tax=Psychrobacter sp. DAB_AL43B TaxID=1028416 RepID=UPI0009A8521E|nr:ribonuclease E inhibitor RraB [Psychrobacter sp. DAB_AL43B]SLJ84955.1 hypothetical protein DABAL43B_1760 [Psychrobacter sp. DAB_AL43B]
MNKELPNDDTGNALQRLKDDGTDLTKMIEMDFFISVPSESFGILIIEKIKEALPNATFDIEEEEDFTCYCKISMIPSYDDVVETESLLNAIAKPYGGYIDGFGSFGN